MKSITLSLLQRTAELSTQNIDNNFFFDTDIYVEPFPTRDYLKMNWLKIEREISLEVYSEKLYYDIYCLCNEMLQDVKHKKIHEWSEHMGFKAGVVPNSNEFGVVLFPFVKDGEVILIRFDISVYYNKKKIILSKKYFPF